MKTLQIPVSDEVADMYDGLAEADRRGIQLPLSMRLEELLRGPRRPLSTIMNEIGAAAENAELTAQVLELLLHHD